MRASSVVAVAAAVLFLTACTTTNIRPTGAPPSPGIRAYYDVGRVTTRDVFVSPISFCLQCDLAATSDQPCSGLSLSTSCRLDEAVRAITSFATTGYRIRLAGGRYAGDLYVTGKRGTREHPLIFQPDERTSAGYARLEGSLEVNSSSFVYFLGDYKRPADRVAGSIYALTLGPGGSPLHIGCSDHVLVRKVEITGGAPPSIVADETVKVNQSTDIYIEQSSIHGASAENGNAVDFVAVRNAHVLDSDLSIAHDWCIYAKGGSHDVNIEGNTIHDCGFDFAASPPAPTPKGGISAGEGTDFPYAQRPFIKYQVSALRVLNNVVYHTAGAGLNVQGAYNAVLAFNTLYDVGSYADVGVPLIEAGYGLVNCNPGQVDCDGNDIHDRCDVYAAAGGWGPTGAQGADGREVHIPNRHVWLVGNVIYNRTFAPRDAHMTIAGAYAGTENVGTAAPQPPRGDDDLRITDNLIWSATREASPEERPAFQSASDAPGAAPSLARNHINEVRSETPPLPLHPRLSTGVPDGSACGGPAAGGDPINCIVVSTALPDMIWDDPTLPLPASGLATRVDHNIFFAPHPPRPGAY